MRTFIAVDAHTSALPKLLEELSSIRGVKPVSPDTLHITLKFLGEIPEARVEEIHSAMKRAFADCYSFKFSIRGVGAFPSARSARVIWAGVTEGKDALIELQAKLEKELLKLRFPREKRAFVPHITLARVKSMQERNKIARFIAEHAHDDLGEVLASEVKLMKSTLTPKGAVYSMLREVRLR
jgi:2'-5' RNA ligase